jgi:hypothetical protein
VVSRGLNRIKVEAFPSVQLKRRAQARIARETADLTAPQEIAYYRRYADNIRQRQAARAHTPTTELKGKRI